MLYIRRLSDVIAAAYLFEIINGMEAKKTKKTELCINYNFLVVLRH